MPEKKNLILSSLIYLTSPENFFFLKVPPKTRFEEFTRDPFNTKKRYEYGPNLAEDKVFFP